MPRPHTPPPSGYAYPFRALYDALGADDARRVRQQLMDAFGWASPNPIYRAWNLPAGSTKDLPAHFVRASAQALGLDPNAHHRLDVDPAGNIVPPPTTTQLLARLGLRPATPAKP